MMHHLFAKTDIAEVIALKDLIPQGEARRGFLQGLASNAASNDIDAAKEIIAHIPESRERVQAVGMFTELYIRKDPVALSEWLGGLDPSPSRDWAVERFATLLHQSDPERARSWAETISDEAKRKRVLEALDK